MNLQTTDYSREARFLKDCADRKSAQGKACNVAKMADGAIIVTSEDMLCLQEGESIGSEVIDCYLQILEGQSNAGLDISKRRILVVQCAFGGTFDPAHGLAFEDHYFKYLWRENWYMWKGVNFLSVDKVYIPWYTKCTTHWSMVVVNKLKRRFEYYNSWLQDPTRCTERCTPRYLRDFHGMLLFISKFVAWQSKQEGIARLLEQSGIKSTSGWGWFFPTPTLKEVGNLSVDEIPGQRKMCDCGVFLCTYVKYLSEARPWDFTHKDVPKLRLMMVRDIVTTFNLQRLPGVDTPDDME